MNKFNLFIKEHGIKIILLLLILIYFKNCSINSEVNKVKKELKIVNEQLLKTATLNDLKIMGLEAEKRMIQATDRKMLDVQRQTAIEEEINKLKSQQ